MLHIGNITLSARALSDDNNFHKIASYRGGEKRRRDFLIIIRLGVVGEAMKALPSPQFVTRKLIRNAQSCACNFFY